VIIVTPRYIFCNQT
jgi:hypothetical protein